MFKPRPKCECHDEPMQAYRRAGVVRYRCATRNREQSRAWAERNLERKRAAAREWAASTIGRHANATGLFSRSASSRIALYEKRATDGSAVVPLRYLWHESAALLELLESIYGPDLEAAAERAGVADALATVRARPYTRFDKCDRICARLELHVNMLGDPMFCTGPPSNPQRKATA